MVNYEVEGLRTVPCGTLGVTYADEVDWPSTGNSCDRTCGKLPPRSRP